MNKIILNKEAVRREMEEQELSYSMLAEMCGCTDKTLRNNINCWGNSSSIKLEFLNKLAKVLNIEPITLITTEDTERGTNK